jgi:hypothetical protein
LGTVPDNDPPLARWLKDLNPATAEARAIERFWARSQIDTQLYRRRVDPAAEAKRERQAFEAMAALPGGIDALRSVLEEMADRARAAEARERAAEQRERAAEAREIRSKRVERIMATAAVLLAVPTAGPPLVDWIDALVDLLA